MNNNQILIGTITRTIFVSLELIALILISIGTFSNDGNNTWGYWGSIAAIFITLSPIIIYVIASAIFNVFNMIMVIRKKHIITSIKKYYTFSLLFLISGIIIGGLYGILLVPFLLENIFLFLGYKKELDIIKKS